MPDSTECFLLGAFLAKEAQTVYRTTDALASGPGGARYRADFEADYDYRQSVIAESMLNVEDALSKSVPCLPAATEARVRDHVNQTRVALKSQNWYEARESIGVVVREITGTVAERIEGERYGRR